MALIRFDDTDEDEEAGLLFAAPAGVVTPSASAVEDVRLVGAGLDATIAGGGGNGIAGRSTIMGKPVNGDSTRRTYLRRSMSCGSTPGKCTLTDCNDEELDCWGLNRFTSPILRQHRYTGFAMTAMNGCSTFGKKLAKRKFSALSPRVPFECRW
uniref:Uncharacterized protein n=1 Tax=Anopheles dirus TaxID=7168 RepID=A0A182NEK8_9DIPT